MCRCTSVYLLSIKFLSGLKVEPAPVIASRNKL
jgi:hypothetical protein